MFVLFTRRSGMLPEFQQIPGSALFLLLFEGVCALKNSSFLSANRLGKKEGNKFQLADGTK